MSTTSTAADQSPHVLVACHAWYRDLIGGSFRLASELAEFLAARGCRVSYICCSTAETTPAQQIDHDVIVYRYPQPIRGGGLSRLRYHVQETAKLVRQVHAEYPVDVLSSHSPLQGLGAAGELRRHDVYINYTVHSPFDDELLSNAGAAGPNLMQRLAGRMARWVDRRNVTLADRVQTDSAYTLRTFERKFGRLVKQKGVVAPGWVEADLFQPAHNRRQLRTQLGGAWNTDDPVFFTLRRLESRMGLDTLVQACSMVARAGLRFQVLIGGDGSQRELLQQMIEDAGLQSCVRLLGRLPEEQLASAYAAADCFVLPTRALECFGLIVLESFACNTPVIASSVAAIPELAERQGTEWMFEPNRADQLADRMNDFLSGRLQVTRNLRNLALEFDKPTILKQWERLLRPHPSPQPVISVS